MKVTTLLILLCILVFPFEGQYQGELSYSFYKFAHEGMYWTLITSLFVHANLGHLAGNMVFLWIFGHALENKIGSGRMLAAYLAGGMLSQLLSFFFYPAHLVLVGASGAISTVIAILMMYSPWRLTFLLYFFPMPMGVAAFTYLLLNFWTAYAQNHGAHGTSNVAYEVHILGFIVGIVIGALWNPDWKKNLIISILSFLGFYLVILGIWYFFLV